MLKRVINTVLILLFLVSLSFAKNYVLENESIKRVISVESTIKTTKLVNKYTQESYTVVSDEFKMMIDNYAADFTSPQLTVKDFTVTNRPQWLSDKILQVKLFNQKYQVKAVIGASPGKPLQKAIRKYDSNLHLRMPLTRQYGLAERGSEEEWYESRGYNTGSNWNFYLKPGSKIFEDKKQRILELQEPHGTLEFCVYLDYGGGYLNKPAFESAVLDTDDEVVEIELNIENAQKIKLEATDAGDNINGDHVDWGDVKIIKE